ncbi:MAG: hypothetical protein Aureis2KO_30890 [Aureisphaera sp.]
MHAGENDYSFRFDMACEFFVNGKEIPDEVLLNVLPYGASEFTLFYERSTSELLEGDTDFFYYVSNTIFEKGITSGKIEFYNAALRLASYADGEFGAYYIEELEVLIESDPGKFCAMAKGQSYAHNNPIKYFLKEYDCDNLFK